MSNESSQNPFESPVEIFDNESLTKAERRTLEFYLKYRDRDLTLPAVLVSYLPSWSALLLTMLVVIGSFSLLVGLSGLTTTIPLAAGILLGILMRDVRYSRLIVSLWPLYTDIVNWETIEKKLKMR